MIKSQVDQLMMNDGENNADFNTKVMDIANESLSTCNVFGEEELVEKVLGSLT